MALDAAQIAAFAARYGFAPPLRATSRLIVEGARPRAAPMARMDLPATRPREISSRSGSESASLDRVRGGGRMPPLGARTEKIEEWPRSNRRPMSCIDSPRRHRSQISARCAAE
jgi:hypothetical protein